MSRGKPHDPKLKERAFNLFADDLTNAEVARKLGVAESTTWDWRTEWAGTEEFENLRRRRRSERAAIANRIAHASAVKLLQAVVNDQISADRLATVYGISLDKALLLEGEATQRMEHVVATSEEEAHEMEERFKRLVEGMNDE